MTFDEYVPLAVRTESRISPNQECDRGVITALLGLTVAVGGLVDLYKKVIFYGRKIDTGKFEALLRNLHGCLWPIDNAARSLAPDRGPLHCDTVFLHGVMGKITEVAELTEQLLLNFDDRPIDKTNVFEELGDDKWYDAILLNHFDWKMGDILEVNIDKLRKRYPDGFSEQAAVHRDLDAERKVLERKPDRFWEAPGFDVWGSDNQHPRGSWQEEVMVGNTNLGYWDWVEHQREGEKS